MDCAYVNNWLLQVEAMQPKDWPRDVTKHLKSCADCAKVARNLNKLEDAWREQPTPPESKTAKARFLTKLRAMAVPATPPAAPARPWHVLAWVAAAAMLLIAVNTFVWVVLWPRPGSDENKNFVENKIQESDVVDRLLDWNLELTNAKPGERKRLFDDREPALRNEFRKARLILSDEEWEDGEELLLTSKKLVENDNPYEEWSLIEGFADKVEARKNATTNQGFAHQYDMRFQKIYERGLQPLDERIKSLLKPLAPDFKFDPKGPKDSKDFKKGGPGWPIFGPPPPQFQQKQVEFRKKLDGFMKKKGSGKGFTSISGPRR
jgi:hypothetical protein